jgi:hypothetical protein
MYLVQLRRDRLISNECLSCPALLLCRYHHLMYASVAPCTPISAVSARDSGAAAGQAALFLSPPPPPPICRRRIKGGRTPASARAPAAAPAAHLPAELRRHSNLCAPAGRGAMVPPPPRPSRAYRRRQRPPPRPPPTPSHPPRPPPRTPLPPSHPLPGRRPDRRPGAAEAPPAATASPPGRPSHRRPLPPPISCRPIHRLRCLLSAWQPWSPPPPASASPSPGRWSAKARRQAAAAARAAAARRPARVHNSWTQFHNFTVSLFLNSQTCDRGNSNYHVRIRFYFRVACLRYVHWPVPRTISEWISCQFRD